MSLTGTPFFLATVALALVTVLIPLLLWGRVGGPALVRGAARLVMVVLAQAAAVLSVFVMVNNANGLYDSWADLLGTGEHVVAAPDLGSDGLGTHKRLADEPRTVQHFGPTHDARMGRGVRVTQLRGRVSGVRGEVYVWLPPQYDEPSFRHRKFPVVELLGGFPGSAKAWFASLRVQSQLEAGMRSGKIAPFILVEPRTNLLAGKDTGCANVPGVVDAESWLSVDVRQMVIDNFRAESRASRWAVAGYSAGAHCAVKMALAHPDRYRAAVGLSGYNDPAAERASLTARDPHLRKVNNPLWILRHATTPPRVSLYLSGSRDDGYRDGLALQRAAVLPTRVAVAAVSGPHTTGLWERQVPQVFRWLTAELSPHEGRTAPAKGV
ncbi:alpha/beta hydrolase [Streptomyces sp. NPDC056061]|uniref:alpha/beta hydrolase n=1 Tax=Streptomyces sp. NPDC056061 TaxID=3345700 RepID=UPI0035DFBD14